MTEDTDEEVLCAMKENGFSRVGPQNQPILKNKSITFTCQVCQQLFKTKASMNKHKETHNMDGDWNCDKCSFQTNSESNLKKHTEAAKHVPDANEHPGIKCNICEKKFFTADEVVMHKRKDHKSFAPCKNLPNCPYQSDCMFNHKLKSNNFICYECGTEFEYLKDLMTHRKKHHTMNNCSKYSRNECLFTKEACWYNHEDKSKPEQANESHPGEKDNNPSKGASQPPVFWERPASPVPPIIPTQATWVKMMSMMTELNQMMKTMKNQNQFQ